MYQRIIVFGLLVSLVFFSARGFSQNGGNDIAAKSTEGHTGPVLEKLTLSKAFHTAMTQSPVLKSAAHQLAAEQARVNAPNDGRPNPGLSVEAEDFLGGGELRGVDSLQITTSLSQEVELGKKAAHRRRQRESAKNLTAINLEIARQQLRADVAMAFLDVLAQQERVKHAKEMVQLAEKTVATIAAQVEAGRSTGMEQDKASVEFTLAQLREKEAVRDLDSARVRLSAACGISDTFFNAVSGDLSVISELPNLQELVDTALAHPQLKQSDAFVRLQQATAGIQKGNGVPNVTFDVGFRWNNATANPALVAGVQVPLPVFDRNRGNIAAASSDVARAQSDAQTLAIAIHSEIVTAYQTLRFELERLKVLREEISPSVNDTFLAVAEGYGIGRFGYLDLLDAQRTMFEIRTMVLDAMVKYQAARITLSYTVGIPVSEALFTASAEPTKETAR